MRWWPVSVCSTAYRLSLPLIASATATFLFRQVFMDGAG